MPTEVIVVNNNSTDGTATIARKYSFVKLINEKKPGLVYARTTGFNLASGDLLVRLDADTRLSVTWLETLVKIAKRHPEIAGFTGRGEFYDVPLPRLSGLVQSIAFQYLQLPAMRGFTLWGSSMAVRQQAWQQVEKTCHMRTDIDEDIDMTLQLRQQGLKVRFDKRLKAGMSLRHGKLSPPEVARYVSTWPRDYWINGRFLAAAYIALLTVATIIFATIAWLLFKPFMRMR